MKRLGWAAWLRMMEFLARREARRSFVDSKSAVKKIKRRSFLRDRAQCHPSGFFFNFVFYLGGRLRAASRAVASHVSRTGLIMAPLPAELAAWLSAELARVEPTGVELS